jgi:hypothetical protein
MKLDQSVKMVPQRKEDLEDVHANFIASSKRAFHRHVLSQQIPSAEKRFNYSVKQGDISNLYEPLN